MVSLTWRRFSRSYAGLCLGILVLSVSGTACSSASKQPDRQSPGEKAKLYVEAANASLTEGDPTGALQYLKQAEALEPKMPEIYHLRAIAFHAKHDLPMAISEMKKALALKPDDSNANNTYGKFLLDSGKYAEAEAPLIKAAHDPLYRDTYKSYSNLGILYYRTNRLTLAEEAFEHANLDDPANSCIAYYYRGHIALKHGKAPDALKFYEKASTKLCSAFPDAHFALGVLYERNRDFDKARRKYLEVKQNFPENPLADQAMERLKKLP